MAVLFSKGGAAPGTAGLVKAVDVRFVTVRWGKSRHGEIGRSSSGMCMVTFGASRGEVSQGGLGTARLRLVRGVRCGVARSGGWVMARYDQVWVGHGAVWCSWCGRLGEFR